MDIINNKSNWMLEDDVLSELIIIVIAVFLVFRGQDIINVNVSWALKSILPENIAHILEVVDEEDNVTMVGMILYGLLVAGIVMTLKKCLPDN